MLFIAGMGCGCCLLYFFAVANKTISGIDGQPSKVDVVKLSSFAIGGHSFGMESVVLADIAALQAFGLERGSALLGMDLFKKFRSVSLNFVKREISFVK